jgi:hypothetical protein
MGKVDVRLMLLILSRKGCKFTGNVIDVSKATELGNKTWGYLEFLCNPENGFRIAGKSDYRRMCFSKFAASADDTSSSSQKEEKRKAGRIPDHVVERKLAQGSLYHAYNDIPRATKVRGSDPTQPEKEMLTSEYWRLNDAHRFINSVSVADFNESSGHERRMIKKAKAEGCGFGNKTVVAWNREGKLPLENVPHRIRKEIRRKVNAGVLAGVREVKIRIVRSEKKVANAN